MQLSNFDILRGFVSKEDIDKILSQFNEHVEIERLGCKPQALNRVNKELKTQIALKLKIIFQRQIALSFQEAFQFYNSNPLILQERLDILYDIIEKVNTEINVTYIPDKLTVASFFRVNAETFDKLMNDAQVDPSVQSAFINVNEFILSTAQIGLETGALNSYTWNRLQLKNKYGGHEIEIHKGESAPQVLIASTDIQRKLASDYDFTKLLGEKEETKEEGN